MWTARLHNWVGLSLALVVTIAFLAGCDKKCQPGPTAPILSITANQWRLIRTTNPRIKNLNRFTFLILSFKPDFEGDVLKVVNNKQFDTPILTFKYNIESDGRSGRLRVVYSSVAPDSGTGGSGASDGGGAAPAASDPVDYDYQLTGRGLTLIETKTGYEYEYVPFVGIVDPDSTCTY